MNAVAEPLSTSARIVPLAEAVELNPRPDRGSIPDDLDVSFVPMAAVEAATGRMAATTVRRFGEVKKGYTMFREGDVLFAKITPCMENGKMAVARGLHNGIGCGSTEFHVLRPKPGVDAQYVYHFVSSARFRAEAAHHMTGAVGQKRVPAAFLEQCEIPLPDLAAQRRIVAEIEKQLSRLDEAVANLKRVKANLKRYKAAILKAAIEGRLVLSETELDRRAGRSCESGADLVLRLLHTDTKKGSSEDWPIVPPGWTVVTVDEALQIIDYRGRTPPLGTAGVPHLRSSNIRDGQIVWDGLAYVSEEAFRDFMTRGLPEKGDLLLTTEAPLGEVALAPELKFSLAQRVIVLRPRGGVLLGAFLKAQLMSPQFQARLQRSSTGSTVTGISARNLKPIEILVPPLAEQQRIADEIERRFSFLEAVHAGLGEGMRRINNLRTATLQGAFAFSEETR